jgi:hypothetical protein
MKSRAFAGSKQQLSHAQKVVAEHHEKARAASTSMATDD